jgi:hypothetical protein
MKKMLLSLFGLLLIGAGCAVGSSVVIDQSSPEAVVDTYFSLFAEDPNSALAVVSEEAQTTSRFERNWEELQTWVYTDYKINEVRAPYVEVMMEITIEGEAESGTDEFTVEEIDGKWWITDIPS